MRNVSNKKIIRVLSLRTMKEKRWKNLIAVLAIALTTLLFTALFTAGSSMMSSLQEATMRQVGTSAHGGYKYLTMEEYERVKAAGGYQDISYDIIAGFGCNPELNGIQTEVRYGEDQQAKWSFSYPEEGKMPEKRNECAASSKVLEALGVPLKTGEKVNIAISSYDAEGNEVIFEEEFTLSGFWYSNDASKAQEFWISREWLDENIDFLSENYNQRMKEKGLSQPTGSLQAGIWFDSSFDIETQMKELTRRAGFSEDEINIGVNWAYGAARVDGFTLLLGIGLLFLIILSGYLIIYNIFYINVTIDIRYYGLLKTIGATGRQLRRMVRTQALLLSAAGIPLGLLTGWFVGRGVMPAVYNATVTDGVTNISLNPWIFVGAALFSLVVVYISCIKPCRLATKVSPIEAVRYVESITYKKKEKKAAKVSMFRMAVANMGRNKKKAAAVIASLSLSLILLNATYALVKGFSFDEYVKDYLLSDMQVTHYTMLDASSNWMDHEAVAPEAVSAIEAIPGVNCVHTVEDKTGSDIVAIEDEMLDRFINYYQSEMQGSIGVEELLGGVKESGRIFADLFHISEGMYSYLDMQEGNFDREKFEQGGYAVLLVDIFSKNWALAGDKVTLETADGTPGKEVEIIASAVLPYSVGTRSLTLGGIRLLLCEKDFRELYDVEGALHACIDVDAEKEEQVIARIEELLETDYPELVLSTKETLRKEFAAENNLFAVIGGLLGLILGLIGVLNLINATITGILTRKQEFAMMQAVGMTGKQLEQMLTMEGILYGVWTLGVAMTFGNLVSYGLVYLIGKNMSYFVWGFHALLLVISIPVIGLLSVILPVVCYHTLCKKSIIERLRLAEV